MKKETNKTSKSSKIINLNSNLYQDILVNKGKTLKYVNDCQKIFLCALATGMRKDTLKFHSSFPQ